MMRKGLLHASCWMVAIKGCFGVDLAVAALEEGGLYILQQHMDGLPGGGRGRGKGGSNSTDGEEKSREGWQEPDQVEEGQLGGGGHHQGGDQLA